MGRTLVTVSTDGYRDYVTLPDGREFNMGSVSVLKLVLELASSGRVARQALDRFLESKSTTLAVEMDALAMLLKPKRARWAHVPEDRLIHTAIRGTMNANNLPTQLDLIEAHLQKLASNPDPNGVQVLRGMVAQLIGKGASTNEAPVSFETKLAAIEALVESGQPVIASELHAKVQGLQKTALDEDAKRELALYMDNESKLYNQKNSILQNILRKMKSGKYDHKQAPKLWLYWVDEGAKMYVKEFGGDVKTTFPKALRESLAQEIANDEKKAIEAGDYASIKVAGDDEDDEPSDDQKDNFKAAARDKHLPGKKGFTACGERAHDDTIVASVKDATCFYCKQAWEKSHKSASDQQDSDEQGQEKQAAASTDAELKKAYKDLSDASKAMSRSRTALEDVLPDDVAADLDKAQKLVAKCLDRISVGKSASTVETTEVQDTMVRGLIAKVDAALLTVTASSKENTSVAKQDLHEISTRLAHILGAPSENSTSQLLDLVAKTEAIQSHFA